MLGAGDLTVADDDVSSEEASLSRDPFTREEAVCWCIMPGVAVGGGDGGQPSIYKKSQNKVRVAQGVSSVWPRAAEACVRSADVLKLATTHQSAKNADRGGLQSIRSGIDRCS